MTCGIITGEGYETLPHVKILLDCRVPCHTSDVVGPTVVRSPKTKEAEGHTMQTNEGLAKVVYHLG
jgi:hypothetical protein